jgi:hypothetical protein
MALDTQLWLTTIQEQLFKNDEFLNTVGLNHDAYTNHKTVHIPQAGSNPTISKNLTVFPAPVGTRTDVDLTYDMDLYYSQPIRIGVDETQFISYDKRASVLSSHLKKMRNVMGNNTLYKWANPTSATAAAIVRTTGTATTKALAPSATGTRKDPKLEDFFSANSILDMQNLNPADSRYALVPANMYWALINDDNIKKNLEWGASPVSPTGKVPIVAGITLLKRSTVVVFDNTGTPVIKTVNDEGTPSSPATTDNLGILVVSESYVSRALGNINIFTKENDPEYFGDIISIEAAFGASKMRTAGEGIVAIVQTT